MYLYLRNQSYTSDGALFHSCEKKHRLVLIIVWSHHNYHLGSHGRCAHPQRLSNQEFGGEKVAFEKEEVDEIRRLVNQVGRG